MKKLIISTIIGAMATTASAALTPAAYPGGEKSAQEYISTNMQYPQMARENGVEGVVTVCFTVNTDGTLTNIKIKRMVDPDLEAEAIRLVKGMPAWIPASDDGVPVSSPAEVKIPFNL